MSSVLKQKPRTSWQMAPKPLSALDAEASRRPPSARSLDNSRRMVFALAAVSALLVIPVAALSFLSQRQDNTPVVDLSFQRMGKTVDNWLSDVEYETDVGNILNGRTHVERDIQSLIHEKPGTAGRKAVVSSNSKGKELRGALKAAAAADGKPNMGGSRAAKSDAAETPLAKHWVQAPAKKRAPVKTAQEQLRDLGGPEIVCKLRCVGVKKGCRLCQRVINQRLPCSVLRPHR